MSPDRIVRRIIVDRLAWIEQMTSQIRTLPVEDREQFFSDRRNELYEICRTNLADIERVAGAYRQWLVTNQDRLDQGL